MEHRVFVQSNTVSSKLSKSGRMVFSKSIIFLLFSEQSEARILNKGLICEVVEKDFAPSYRNNIVQ